MVRSVAILCKPIAARAREVVPSLIDWLRARGIAASLDCETQKLLGQQPAAENEKNFAAGADLLIVLGGDGTLLSAARELGGKPIPILAVNLGALGFLTTVPLDELYPLLEQVLAGKHQMIRRMMLDAQVCREGRPPERQCALNDAVVNKAALARMLDFDVFVDQDHVGRYRADGLIVATPTGSTAYSLAAGGPVVHPSLEAFVITPICPHMLTNRPLVVPDTACVELAFAEAQEPVYLTLDGQVGFQLEPKDRVVITKSAARVHFVRPARSYFQILSSKLRWGER